MDKLSQKKLLLRIRPSPSRFESFTQMKASNSAIDTKTIGSRGDFEKLFRTHYSYLCAFANKFLKDQDAAEEIVQEVFVNLWKKRNELSINTSLKSYLFTAVRNSSLNLIKHINIRENYKAHNKLEIEHQENYLGDSILANELEERIHTSINMLPTERKKIFILSRYEGLKYREIAEKLNISVKTVENQMGKAMKALRESLKDYLTVTILILLEIMNNH